jgi:hypothetical protein
VDRELVGLHVRRFAGWEPLCTALTAIFGVPRAEVAALDADVDPAVRVQVETHATGFAATVELYVDRRRAPRPPAGELPSALARMLGEDVAYDDGESENPYRWMLARPDGQRVEVFQSTEDSDGLILDERPRSA